LTLIITEVNPEAQLAANMVRSGYPITSYAVHEKST